VFIRTPVATATAIAVQAWRASLLRQAPGTFQFDSQHLPLVARSTSSASLLAWPHAMAPKMQPNAQKAATILAWFHRTAQAHNIKDLEKTLPQVSSISGMHVKDYLQSLSDDNKIRVEKIGSGNWYWSFPSDEKKAKDAALVKAREENSKAHAATAELQCKVEAAGAARAEEIGEFADALRAPRADSTRRRPLDAYGQARGPSPGA